ncbi:ADP-ribosylation factor protein 1 [Mactra antiquata]
MFRCTSKEALDKHLTSYKRHALMAGSSNNSNCLVINPNAKTISEGADFKVYSPEVTPATNFQLSSIDLCLLDEFDALDSTSTTPFQQDNSNYLVRPAYNTVNPSTYTPTMPRPQLLPITTSSCSTPLQDEISFAPINAMKPTPLDLNNNSTCYLDRSLQTPNHENILQQLLECLTSPAFSQAGISSVPCQTKVDKETQTQAGKPEGDTIPNNILKEALDRIVAAIDNNTRAIRNQDKSTVDIANAVHRLTRAVDRVSQHHFLKDKENSPPRKVLKSVFELFKMYTLFSGLWKYMFQKDEYNVLILGLDNAGKTTYLEQTKMKFTKNYQGMNLNKITTTVGLNIGTITIGGVKLKFWDLGGQEELQSLWDKYYAESHAVIYIVDSSDKERIDESKEAFDKMIVNESLNEVPLLLLANKQDLQDVVTVGDIKSVFNSSREMIGHRDCRVNGVSALKGDGINDGIEWMVDCIKRNSLVRPPIQKDIT